jgi:sialate O-acetylesterase
MIHPLKNLKFTGVLWYQGESNVDRRNEYADLLTAMIGCWRETFNDNDLPFYIVELADFLHKDDVRGRKAWAEMRIQQDKVAQTNPNTMLIKNSDLGEWNDIHPLDKKTLGKRAAEATLKNMK